MERLFSERARQLRRPPRPQAWQRLERRLDERARRRRVGWYRLGGIAAAVLITVGLAWGLTQTAYAPADSRLASLDERATAPETLAPVAVEAVNSYRLRARQRADSPIVEGDRDKQLVVVAPDGRKLLPTIAPAPQRTRVERISRLRVRPDAEWRNGG